MDLKKILFEFIWLTIAGTHISMGFIKQSTLEKRYYIYHGLSGFLLLIPAFIFMGKSTLPIDVTYWFISFVLFGMIYYLTLKTKKRISESAFFISIICLFGSLYLYSNLTSPGMLNSKTLLNLCLSLLTLGFTLNSMMLGHWYLIQPTLPIEELKRLTLIMSVLIFLRFIFGTFQVYEIMSVKTEIENMRYFTSATEGVFTLMRYLWGLFCPIILCYLVVNTVKIRSTQSATGILYVLVLSVFTGEILSLYLMQTAGIFF